MAEKTTITSKRQVTIPIKAYKQAGLKTGQKLYVDVLDGRIILTSAERLIEETAGMLHDKVPKELYGQDIDKVIAKGTKKYFTKRAKRGL